MTETIEVSEETTLEDTTSRRDSKDFTWTKDRIVLAIIFTIIVLVSVALLVLIIWDKTFLFSIVRDYFIAPILTLHIALRVFIFICIMVLQSLLVPIPSELILLTGGMLFGLGWGSFIGVVGSTFSAAVTFYLSKRGGRAIVDAAGKKSGIIDRTIYIFDEWIKRWGLWAIIVGRAVPVIMFDPISYAAGLSKVKDTHYFLATFIGSIPRAIFYAFFGVQLLGNNPPEYILELTQGQIDEISNQFNLYFFIIFGILIVMFIISNVIYYVQERKKKQEIDEEETDEDFSKESETQELEENNMKESETRNDE